MKILGINTGIGASICLMEEGRVFLALEEERPTRIKGKGGLPLRCFEYARENHAEFMNDLDCVALADLSDVFIEREDLSLRYDRRFGRDEEPRQSGLLSSLRSVASKHIPEGIKRAIRPLPAPPDLVTEIQNELSELEIPRDKFVRLRHHDCHASAAYFGLVEEWERPYLILTLDGGGDSECASVSVGERGQLRRVAGTPSGNAIGNIYSNITYLLGLKPHEHEYKIMGLEPYVPQKYRAKVCEILRSYLHLDSDTGLTFERTTPENTNWIGPKLAQDLQYMRFDSIAAGLQQFTEELIVEWVRNAIRHTGVADVLLSGGVFMNVKANKLISEIPEVRSVNVFPSCGDESNSLGVAFHTYAGANGGRLPDFDSYTLGPSPSFDFQEAQQRFSNSCRFEKLSDPNGKVAELLAQGHVVARCAGPMEVGARALGNRSLLADPSNPDVVERLNFMIKQRDFWMPFAPAILAEDAERYLEIPDAAPTGVSPYMMFAFETKETRTDMPAALHRADRTARAQIVSRDLYPDFHEVISNFRELTGRGALLNTSFNRHGEPIVMGTIDAVEILLATDLEYLVVEDHLITKL
ncbi:MAG: hypothetical protein CL569_16350 [Alphaproteobacteria bacterium]|nr:hypothetical protein [Alphaproteobacteria bacterium]|tara:strand:- start:3326 stop:5074 length:1749 start_codon:yes stop_codon:yes gene_type:complete